MLDPSDYRSFVAALAAKNQRWVDGAQGLSRPLVIDLLRWAGEQMDAYYATMNLTDVGGVVWASDDGVPVWFDIAQDLTERWVHQRQMREALARVIDPDPYLPEVLRTFVWAFPHQYRATAKEGTEVEVALGRGATWTLTSDGATRWSMHERQAKQPAASLALTEDAAWRTFTGAEAPASGVSVEGDPLLSEPLLKVRGIIV